MVILYIILAIIAVIWVGFTGFVLIFNAFRNSGDGVWTAMFGRFTTVEKIVLSPGLIWVLPIIGAAWIIRVSKNAHE